MNAMFQNLLENKLWITEDLESIAIEDMTTPHIKAALHKIYKSNGTWRREYLRIFENELRKRKFEKNESI